MRWIRVIFNFIIREIKLFELDRSDINHKRRNPATGLPMVGSVDTMGNPFGSDQESRRHDPLQRRLFLSTRHYD